MDNRATQTDPGPPPRRHLSGSILSVALSRGGSLALIALASIVVARILGPSGLGTVALAQALLLVVTYACELGLPQAVPYYAGRGEWAGRALTRHVVVACFALAAPGAAALLAAFAVFGDSLGGLSWPMAIALAVAVPFSLLWRVAPQVALAEERFEAFTALDAAPALLLLPLTIAGAALAGTEGAVVGLALSLVASGALAIAWLGRRPGGRLDGRAPRGGAGAVLGFGLPAWTAELLTQVDLRAHLILVGGIAGASEGGVYSIALSVTTVAWTLMSAFAVSALPRTARLGAGAGAPLAGQRGQAARTTRHAVLAMPFVGAAVALLIWLGIPALYGAAFDRSVGLAFILLPGSLLLGLGMTAIAILLGGGETGRVVRACLAVVPATVLACAVAIPAGGASAAAIVATASYAALALLATAELRRASGLGLAELLVPRRSDLADYRALLGRWSQRLRGAPAPPAEAPLRRPGGVD